MHSRTTHRPPTAAIFLGVDLSQSAAKVSAVDGAGRLIALGADSFRTDSPEPGWRQQDPESWVRAVAAAVTDVLAKLGTDSADGRIAGIGLSGAAHHGVVLQRSSEPIYPCILLSDTRAIRQARRLREDLEDEIFAVTGNLPAPAWTLTHFLWLAENHPDIWARRARVMFAKDYVRWRLTGAWYTDHIEAEGSLFYDRRTRSWSRRLCELVGLDEEQLPPIREARTVSGSVSPAGAQLTGIPSGTPVIAGCSDTAAEAYAAGAARSGEFVIKIATAGNVHRLADDEHLLTDRRLISYSYVRESLKYQCLATVAAGLSAQWFQHILATGPNYDFARMDEEAAEVEPGSGGILYHPYLSGERAPRWNPHLKASFTGLTMEHGRSHLIRAVYEGVAYSLRECLDLFRGYNVEVGTAYLVGGGARSSLWSQILADVLAVPLTRPSLSEASSGAAVLALEGVTGASPSDRERNAGTLPTVEPLPQNVATYDQLFPLYGEAGHNAD